MLAQGTRMRRGWGALVVAATLAGCSGAAPNAPGTGSATPVIAAVRVTGLPPELSPGTTVTLHAEAVLSNGAVKQCSALWTIDDPRVATISPAGLLTAQVTGYATVTAACEQHSAQALLKVSAVNPYTLIIVAYDSEVPNEFGIKTVMEFLDGPRAGERVTTDWIFSDGLTNIQWPVRVRFTADDFAPVEFVLAESTGSRRNSKSHLFDFRVPMTFTPDASTDTYVRRMSQTDMEIAHPFVMRQPGPVVVRTWWSVDYNDTLAVQLWCNGALLASRTQLFGSAGNGLTHDAPAGACETRLRQGKRDAYTHYRVAIRYPR